MSGVDERPVVAETSVDETTSATQQQQQRNAELHNQPQQQSTKSYAGERFDFCAPLSGPANMAQLADMMQRRGIANDAELEFSQEFVAQFYNDNEQTPGDQCMFNGEPSVWGEKVWDLFHLIPYYYPAHPSDDVKRAAYQNVHSFRFLLPCEHCRRGFRKEILETPVEEYLDSRETFLEWSIEVHTSVNQRLGKPKFDVDATFKRLLAREHTAAAASSQPAATDVKTNSRSAAANDGTNSSASKKSAEKEPKQNKSTPTDTQVVQRSSVSNTVGGTGGRSGRLTNGAPTPTATTATPTAMTTKPKGPTATNTNNQPSRSAASSAAAVQKTTYGNTTHNMTANESLQSIRDALRRNGQRLSLQQKANLQKMQLAQQAKNIKEPAECKSCGGKNKPKTPSVF